MYKMHPFFWCQTLGQKSASYTRDGTVHACRRYRIFRHLSAEDQTPVEDNEPLSTTKPLTKPMFLSSEVQCIKENQSAGRSVWNGTRVQVCDWWFMVTHFLSSPSSYFLHFKAQEVCSSQTLKFNSRESAQEKRIPGLKISKVNGRSVHVYGNVRAKDFVSKHEV